MNGIFFWRQLRRRRTSLGGTGVMQPVAAQDTFVRIRGQNAPHQQCEPGFSDFSRACICRDSCTRGARVPRLQSARLPNSALCKMPYRDKADLPPQQFHLSVFLAFLLLRAVMVILLGHRAATERQPPTGVSDIDRGNVRCARLNGSFWPSELSSNTDIGPSGSGATGLGYGYDRDLAGHQN